jgi:hypothetical protein
LAVICGGYEDTGTAHDLANSVAYIISHELAEAVTNPFAGGYFYSTTTKPPSQCEIGDVCEASASEACCKTFRYLRTWDVEKYWSNFDMACVGWSFYDRLQLVFPYNQVNSVDISPVNQGIQTANRRYSAGLQADGNFVAYGPDGAPLWATNTVNPPGLTPPYAAVMQQDGNFVIYGQLGPHTGNASNVVYASNTQGVGTGPWELVITHDGALVILANGTAIWRNGARL